MPAPVVETVRNTADGEHLLVTLAAPPTGSFQFYAARQPGVAGEGVLLAPTAQPAAGTTVLTSGYTQPPVPKPLRVFGSQGTCTGSVVVEGLNQDLQPVTESFTLSGTANVDGVTPFLTITQITIPQRGAAGDAVSIRTYGTEVASSGAGTSWTLQIRTDPTPIRLGYYVLVIDQAGESNEEAEWLCYGTALDLQNQIEAALHDLVADNRKLLARSLQEWMGDVVFPSGAAADVVKVIRGYPPISVQNVYPVISVRVHGQQVDLWFGNPYEDGAPIQGTLTVYFFHAGKTPAEALVRALGMGVFNVLNQRHNLSLYLDCGLVVKATHCADFHTEEEFLGGSAGYVATATMSWQGEVYLGKEL